MIDITYNFKMAQSTQSAPAPLYTFDAHLSKVTDSEGKFQSWKFTIAKKDFPASQLGTGESHTFVLDSDKYKNSFEQYSRLLGLSTVPESLYTYTVSATEDSIVVTGMTESTVRIAVVDLVSKSNSNTKLMMVRPPISFRVYSTVKTTPTTDGGETADVDLGGVFGMFGEAGDY